MEDYNDDTGDGRTEEDKTPAETSRKRKLKTPVQLQALEEFYEEHKYPTESMKSEIAEKIGLTEKQVSGWFCHRRLKDKRVSKDEADGSGRMDRSSGVIQEHFSGPAQDSCGSTKPGEYNKRAELREVESQWPAVQEFSPMNLACSKRKNIARQDDDMDDTSSESGSPLRPGDLPQHGVPRIWGNSRSLMQNGAALPSNQNLAVRTQSRRPSGYLKIKPKAEHFTIAAVKKRLGMNFRVDGPPLGIEFDPLPIGAFQAAPMNTTTGLSNGAEALMRNISGRYHHGAHSRHKMQNGFLRPDDYEQGPTVCHGSEAFYSYAQETYSNKGFPNRAKYDSKVLSNQPISSYREETPTADQTDDSLDNSGYLNPETVQKSRHMKNQLSNTKHRQRKSQDTQERILYTREPEVENFLSARSNTSKRRNLGTTMVTPKNELMDELLLPSSNTPKTPPEEKLFAEDELKDKSQFGYPHPVANREKLASSNDRGAVGEIGSSSSEYETGETSSSDDE